VVTPVYGIIGVVVVEGVSRPNTILGEGHIEVRLTTIENFILMSQDALSNLNYTSTTIEQFVRPNCSSFL